jgi:hypothetical protein
MQVFVPMLRKIITLSMILLAVCAVILALPRFAYAFPFGGQAYIVAPCFNVAIYANLGPPRGGPFVWTPTTVTYENGPPTHPGQWILGLAGVPYFCIVNITPLTIWPGTYITMMGSSQ